MIAGHTVRITEDGLEFTCHCDRNADCHRYPDCECESWDADHESEYGHPPAPHDECWMQAWFDNDCVCPNLDCIDDHKGEAEIGMSGPITAAFCEDYVEWEFTDSARKIAA
ncbi:hypothetical protein CH289_07805 [Rhodococcus sp. RS1C4]|nr:hypothetical protein CH289_07805 [Rhodococcus sp. RS1C4]